MGAFNAHILIGKSHPYEGGIIQMEDSLHLSENGMACWHLVPKGIARENSDLPKQITRWIPTVQKMLEDGLLMVALFVWKDEELVALAKEAFRVPLEKVSDLSSDIRPVDLVRLHDFNRQKRYPGKLVITTQEGSSILKQLKILEQYQFEVEVCTTVYSRHLSVWNGEVEVRGELE